MKTIEQHFKDNLPNEICKIAIKNATQKETRVRGILFECERFETALINAFTWQKTNEGWDYWNEIFKKYPIKND